MPINAIFGKTIIWSNYTFQKIMNLIWLDMLLKVGGNHQPGFEIWKPFEMHFGNGKGICHIDVFCIFAKVAIVTMSKFL